MAVTASAQPVAASASNPARLIDARSIEASLGILVAGDQLRINRNSPSLDTYVAYQFGLAAALPLGNFRDRLFLGINVHLPHNSLYEVQNTAASTPVILDYGSDARRFSLDAAIAVRIWKRIAIGMGFHLMPNVNADVNIDFINENDSSYSVVNVDYKAAPSIGIYAEPIPNLHLGFAYRAATRLDLSVPAQVNVSNAIGNISVRLDGHAYSEPHDFKLGIRYNFSDLTDIQIARFALDLDFQLRYFPYPIATSANVTLYDDEGGVLNTTSSSHDNYNYAWALRTAVSWFPTDFISVALGCAFKKSPVPAQRNIFNVLDSDSTLLSFGTTLWLPEEYLGSFGIGFSTSALLEFHASREMEKYEFLVGNPGFPAIRFEGFHASFHAAILLRFE